MKYLILVPDGMADRPSEKLNGSTPMDICRKPVMDELARCSLCGTVLNVPKGMVPESDTANLAIMSYDPKVYSKGRSPLEAVSLGIKLEDNDTAIRCNLVTLSDEDLPYEELTMVDHSADEITTEEADILCKAINSELGNEKRNLYTGISYRHCLIWKDICADYDFSRPHDIIGRKIKEYIPKGEKGKIFLDFMKRGYDVINHHPVNEKRRAQGKHPANSPWLWSPGTNPSLPSFKETWGIDAAVVSAVDLIKGIGLCAGMKVIDVPGATGNYHTNYEGKASAATAAFSEGNSLVYIHVEAPDECGHRGEYDIKPLAIEKIDSLILKPLKEYLDSSGEPYRILVLPDHPTPLDIRTHSSEPVPFFLYDSERKYDGVEKFNESNCEKKNFYIDKGQNLMSLLVKGEIQN